ncbi:MAG: aminodeoxychorismate synthase component I [Gammaproteobacteria bacterium]|nr:aminodeoxychorismate synthase component I [Gammaproteobacteria bacterium]
MLQAVDYDVHPARLHALAPQRYPFLLESAARHGAHARYDLLFAATGETLAARPGRPFLDELDEAWRRVALPDSGASLPFSGGWFIYLGYELAGQIEPRLVLPQAATPMALATRCEAALIRDHREQRAWLIAEPQAGAVLTDMAADISRAALTPWPEMSEPVELLEAPGEEYEAAVRQARELIAAGDVFQTNLSRRWQANYDQPPDALALYRQLCLSNPGPFAGLARYHDFSIISSSPERLLSVREGRVNTRPIAGTRPRDALEHTDRRLRRALHRSPKERAEHVMLIDLERNDLGRICTAGSVVVDEFMVLESYAHVHHIVSNVSGRLRRGITPGEAIAAVFPGGTITGCPKVRCMEIIAELEGQPRGPYTGSMGYVNRDGSMDLNILIRTLVQQQCTVELRAGAGIVADSLPARELAETRAKARGLLLALGVPG